ncbi:hypothetical protein SISNIDRAFT_489374 [Sistotremastrum niveocremeum HHB9708]|uniref:Uncharacterized protein n=1 Tax=Sistotremastrum niveocremeum HHB9708 TaxID=1314777 RepID=A0A164Q887_9AGAM|nr:hypothetical protein SISNIDRAFT_489374 [Sistotremastrum niveocremeum HHB9708]
MPRTSPIQPTPDAPFAFWDLRQAFAQNDASFFSKRFDFYRNAHSTDIGVHLSELIPPPSLCVRYEGQIVDRLEMVDQRGTQKSFEPEQLFYGWYKLNEICDDPQFRHLSTLSIHKQTSSHVAFQVAHITRAFLNMHFGPPYFNSVWRCNTLGDQDLDYDKLILCSLHNVAPGIWQPVFSYGTRYKSDYTRGLKFATAQEQAFV